MSAILYVLRELFPLLHLRRSHTTGCHSGLQPLTQASSQQLTVVSSSMVLLDSNSPKTVHLYHSGYLFPPFLAVHDLLIRHMFSLVPPYIMPSGIRHLFLRRDCYLQGFRRLQLQKTNRPLDRLHSMAIGLHRHLRHLPAYPRVPYTR